MEGHTFVLFLHRALMQNAGCFAREKGKNMEERLCKVLPGLSTHKKAMFFILFSKTWWTVKF
jgi:hypothetical protein